MASEATPPAVATLLEFINYELSKDDAIQLLKISNNSVEAAASKFYETERHTLTKLLRDSVPRWDETAFGAGREGEYEPGNTIPTFNIDYAPGFDNYPHSGVQSNAPTRPPSRTSQRSAMSTHHGDPPMQSIENSQETGFTGNSGPYFGPATQVDYDTAQWAMVPTSTMIIPDPIATERQKEPGQPVFLKPSSRPNYLPALIAILHSIPLYRNAFLASTVTQRSYWLGDEWWRGNPALPSRVIGSTTSVDDLNALDILHETQRLMAFLDESDRAYTTVGSLLELNGWKEGSTPPDDPDDDLLKFLQLWCDAYQRNVPNADLNGWIRSVVDIRGKTVESLVLDPEVAREHSNMTLYDAIDDHLLGAQRAHITELSKVLVFRVTSSTTDAKDLGCRVPATLYLDRYLAANKSIIDSIDEELQEHDKIGQGLGNAIDRLKYHTPSKGDKKQLDTLKMLETTMKAFQPRDGELQVAPNDAQVLSQLQDLYSNIQSKIAALEQQTEQVKATLESIRNRFKPTVDDNAADLIDLSKTEYPQGQSPQDAMHHPYRLRGLATNLGVVYLLHPDTESNVQGAQQWWRMQYDTESAHIRRDRLTEDEVVERASSESASALLVYAHDDALNVDPLPLSKELQDFVKKDGVNFLEELQQCQIANNDWDYDTSGDVAQGEWADNGHPPDYNYDNDWNSMSAQEFHNHQRHDSNLSSTTLTPNTEHDDDGGVREMVEINGGMDALTRLSHVPSASSSQTIGRDSNEAMEIDELRAKEHAPPSFTDTMMADVQDEPRVQHIEVSEKKGG